MKKIFTLSMLIYATTVFSQHSRLRAVDSSEHHENVSYMNQDNPFVEIFFEIGAQITFGILFETYWERDLPMHDAQFTCYPYFDDFSGNYTYNTENYDPFKLVLSANWLGENKDSWGTDFGVKLKFLQRVDVAFNYTHVKNASEVMPVYDFMLHYHRIRTPKFDFWYGLGAMHLSGDVEETGISLDFGAEWFIHKPISLLAQWQYGYFEQGNIVKKSSFLVKYYWTQTAFHLGAVNMQLFDVDYHAIAVGLSVTL